MIELIEVQKNVYTINSDELLTIEEVFNTSGPIIYIDTDDDNGCMVTVEKFYFVLWDKVVDPLYNYVPRYKKIMCWRTRNETKRHTIMGVINTANSYAVRYNRGEYPVKPQSWINDEDLLLTALGDEEEE